MNLMVTSILMLSIFIGVALAMSSCRRFVAERWYFQVWLWIFCSLLIIVIHFFLINLLNFDSTISLILALAVVSWFYFSLPEQLTKQRHYPNKASLSDILPIAIEFLMRPYTVDQLEMFWFEQIEKIFEPLSIEIIESKIQRFDIANNGTSLLIPRLTMLGNVELLGCSKGSRLFQHSDLSLMKQLWSILNFGYQQNQARQMCETHERNRIMRDLHDDVCANLVTMTHFTDNKTSQIARATLNSLRETIYSLHENSLIELENWLENKRIECVDRCVDFDLDFEWHVEIERGLKINARQQVNLSRILQEVLTNAIKHAEATSLQFHFMATPVKIHIKISDNGKLLVLPQFLGNGWHNLRWRCADLGGEICFAVHPPHGLEIQIQIPL